jgi:tetratricopeptide (TPR) repeat protein
MKFYHKLLLLTFLGLLGCGSMNSKTPTNSAASYVTDDGKPLTPLSHAHLMLRQGKIDLAMTEYTHILGTPGAEQDREQARLGLAKCLLQRSDYASASALLSPLRMPARDEIEMQKLAVAGEAMLRLGQNKEAQIVLKSARENVQKTTGPMPSWMAACSGNLGYAYLKNGRPDKAFILYRQTADLYRQQGNMLAAYEAQRMADELESVLKQYMKNKSILSMDE